MIDPITLHIVYQTCIGLRKAFKQALSIGRDRTVSKDRLLDIAAKALSNMTELQKELGDDLCVEDKDKSRTFVEEYV